MVEQWQVNLTLMLNSCLQNSRANPERFTCDLRLSAECSLVFSYDSWKPNYTVTTGHCDFSNREGEYRVTLLFINEGFKANERSRGRWQIANFRFKISRRN
jgi:hypothetical protein